jgi:hypothetical protein
MVVSDESGSERGNAVNHRGREKTDFCSKKSGVIWNIKKSF